MRRALQVMGGLLIVFLVAPLMLLYLRNLALGERVVDEVARLSSTRQRPIHREPSVGTTYEACLGPLLDVAPDAGAFALGSDPAVAREIDDAIDGGRTVASLEPQLRENLAVLAPWAMKAAGCTRAPAVGDEPGMGPFAGWDEPRQNTRLYPPVVAKLVALQMRTELEGGDPTSALQHCSDVLALGRDTAFDRGLIGAMLSVAMTKSSLQPCAAAINAAETAALRHFVDEVHAIRSGSPSFGWVLEIERAEMQVLAFGRNLSSTQTKRLTANGRALASNTQLGSGLDRKRLAGWFYWPFFVERADRLIAAADSPSRDKIFEKIDAEQSLLVDVLNDGMPGGSMLKFAQRYDTVGQGLDLLESAARVRLGEAPLGTMKFATSGGRTRIFAPGQWTDAFVIEVVGPAAQ